MTSPPQPVLVDCPRCRQIFEAWYRPSINLSLGEVWSKEDVDDATTAKCPTCQHQVLLNHLVVREDGVFHLQDPHDS